MDNSVGPQMLQLSLQDRSARSTGQSSAWSTNFDGLENILSRLPIVSVLQCRSVCKLWNETICSWSFRRLWSKVYSMKDPWTVLVAEDRLGFFSPSLTWMIFYNAIEWRIKELNLGQLLESRGYGSVLTTDGINLATSTAKGLFLYMQINYTTSEISIIVLNPLTSFLQHVSLPPSVSRVIFTSRVVSEEIIHVEPHGPEIEERQSYKVLLICYHPGEGWKCYVYNSLTETWMNVPVPPRSETLNKLYATEEDVTVDLYEVRRFSKVHSSSSDWVGEMFHCALWLWFEEDNGTFRGCLELVSFDAEKDNCSSLCIPWSWDPITVPSRLLVFIQRDNILAAPFLHLEEDDEFNKRLSIKINTLQIRHEGSEMYTDDEIWHTRATMPSVLFEDLYSDENEDFECYTGVDECTDQLLFFSKSNTCLQIVAYRFSPSSPDYEWHSFRCSLEEDIGLNEILLAPSTTFTLLPNFNFRLDSIP